MVSACPSATVALSPHDAATANAPGSARNTATPTAVSTPITVVVMMRPSRSVTSGEGSSRTTCALLTTCRSSMTNPLPTDASPQSSTTTRTVASPNRRLTLTESSWSGVLSGVSRMVSRTVSAAASGAGASGDDDAGTPVGDTTTVVVTSGGNVSLDSDSAEHEASSTTTNDMLTSLVAVAVAIEVEVAVAAAAAGLRRLHRG